MYSVVLMMTMTTAPDLPNCGRKGGCYGSSSAYGGCYGGARYGGCYGGGQRYYSGGCYGASGPYSSSYGPAYYTTPDGRMIADQPIYPNNGGPTVIVPANAPPPTANSPPPTAPATVRVTLPEDAALFVDSNPTATRNLSVREFVTPPLDPNREYTYTLTASAKRDQKETKVDKQIKVRAGQVTEVKFEMPPTSPVPPE